MWGGHVGINISKKAPAKAAMAITAAKCQEVAALCRIVLAVTNFATLFGDVKSLVFK
jgi:hypothetical protein